MLPFEKTKHLKNLVDKKVVRNIYYALILIININSFSVLNIIHKTKFKRMYNKEKTTFFESS